MPGRLEEVHPQPSSRFPCATRLFQRLVIEEDVSVGANAVILDGAHIGRGRSLLSVRSSRAAFRPMRSGE